VVKSFFNQSSNHEHMLISLFILCNLYSNTDFLGHLILCLQHWYHITEANTEWQCLDKPCINYSNHYFCLISQYLTLYTDIYEALNTCKQEDGGILQWNTHDIFLQGLPQNMVLTRIFEFKLYSYRVLYWQLLLVPLQKKIKFTKTELKE